MLQPAATSLPEIKIPQFSAEIALNELLNQLNGELPQQAAMVNAITSVQQLPSNSQIRRNFELAKMDYISSLADASLHVLNKLLAEYSLLITSADLNLDVCQRFMNNCQNVAQFLANTQSFLRDLGVKHSALARFVDAEKKCKAISEQVQKLSDFYSAVDRPEGCNAVELDEKWRAFQSILIVPTGDAQEDLEKRLEEIKNKLKAIAFFSTNQAVIKDALYANDKKRAGVTSIQSLSMTLERASIDFDAVCKHLDIKPADYVVNDKLNEKDFIAAFFEIIGARLNYVDAGKQSFEITFLILTLEYTFGHTQQSAQRLGLIDLTNRLPKLKVEARAEAVQELAAKTSAAISGLADAPTARQVSPPLAAHPEEQALPPPAGGAAVAVTSSVTASAEPFVHKSPSPEPVSDPNDYYNLIKRAVVTNETELTEVVKYSLLVIQQFNRQLLQVLTQAQYEIGQLENPVNPRENAATKYTARLHLERLQQSQQQLLSHLQAFIVFYKSKQDTEALYDAFSAAVSESVSAGLGSLKAILDLIKQLPAYRDTNNEAVKSSSAFRIIVKDSAIRQRESKLNEYLQGELSKNTISQIVTSLKQLSQVRLDTGKSLAGDIEKRCQALVHKKTKESPAGKAAALTRQPSISSPPPAVPPVATTLAPLMLDREAVKAELRGANASLDASGKMASQRTHFDQLAAAQASGSVGAASPHKPGAHTVAAAVASPSLTTNVADVQGQLLFKPPIPPTSLAGIAVDHAEALAKNLETFETIRTFLASSSQSSAEVTAVEGEQVQPDVITLALQGMQVVAEQQILNYLRDVQKFIREATQLLEQQPTVGGMYVRPLVTARQLEQQLREKLGKVSHQSLESRSGPPRF